MPADYVIYGKYLGVDSLVGAPKDPEIAYMAYSGQIFRSTNQGGNWLSTAFGQHGVRMEANGEGRQEGERLGVDPHNSNVVYFCSIADGLWRTEDAGGTWKRVDTIPPGEPPHGVNTVVFDKNSGTIVANGTSRTRVVYVTVDQGGVFQSKDAGATWTNIAETGPGNSGRVRDAEIGPDGVYYVACDNARGAVGSIWKYSGTWQDITPSGDQGGNQSYCAIAVDPSDPQRVVAMRNGGRCFVSVDQGASWSSHGFRLKSPQIKWMGEQENYWLSVGEIAFDPFNAGQLWLAEGFGVWLAHDLTSENVEWQAESAGIEEACGNDIICPPGCKPVAAMWDTGLFHIDNPDAYNARRAFPWFMSAWALDWCPADPKFIVSVSRNHLSIEPHVHESGYSIDGGVTWARFPAVEKKEIPEDLEYGLIAVSANSPDKIVWAPARKKLPYYTADRGVSWKQSSLGEGVGATGFDMHYSPQKSLCADRVLADTFYLYHPEEGIFRSMNGGAVFTKIGVPPAAERVNAVMKTIPGHAGHLWFAEGHQGSPVGGIWHSQDGGATWKPVPFIEQAFNFGIGKPKEENGYPTLFVAGIADGETGIYRSTDAGDTWDKICDYPLEIFDWIDAMDGDKEVFGKVYLAFSNHGFAYGEETEP